MNEIKILPEFTRWGFNLYDNMYIGFGRCGSVQMLFRGQTIVVDAYNFSSGNDGNFLFHIVSDSDKKETH